MSISFETLALAKRYTNSAVADAIGGVTSIDFRFVESLPWAGDPGVIYCVPSGGSEPDLYDEYYYVNGRFERIPGAKIDLTPYATKDWVTGEGYYKKPADGIPGSDLDAALRASIAKAETALQQHQSLAAYRTAQEQDEIDNTLANIKEVEVSDTEPTDPNVKLWMYQNPGQKIEIPTMEDFRNLKPATDEQVSAAVSDWLEENISGGETIAVDKSLTVEGAAADAKAVGDLKSAVETVADAVKSINNQKTKLSVETYTFFPFTRECVSFNQNTPFIVSGSAGNTVLTITGERSGSTLVNNDKWGAIVIQVGNRYLPYRLIDYTDTTITIDPALDYDVTDGILAPLLADSQHLTKYGYIAYMQHINLANPKHCEKNKYVAKYHPVNPNSPTPFVTTGGISMSTLTFSYNDSAYIKRQYSSFGTILYPYAEHSTVNKYGLRWAVNTKDYNGYLETFIGVKNQSVSNYYKDTNHPMHIVVYADDEIIFQKDKTTNIIERICVDYTASQKVIKLEVYYDTMRRNSEDSIFIGETTFWINEKYPNAILPAGAAVSMLFDSWGTRGNETSITEPATPWHSGATWPQGQAGETLKQILAEKTGLVCPVFNTSRGFMTSRWGKAWFGVAVREKKPNVMLTDFGINDYHTSTSGTWENINDPYGNTIVMANNPLTTVEYANNMKMIFDMAIMSDIQPVFIEPNVGASLEWTLDLLYRLSERVT